MTMKTASAVNSVLPLHALRLAHGALGHPLSCRPDASSVGKVAMTMTITVIATMPIMNSHEAYAPRYHHRQND